MRKIIILKTVDTAISILMLGLQLYLYIRSEDQTLISMKREKGA